MSMVAIGSQRSSRHPLDVVEEFILATEWVFERSSDDELTAEVKGRWCDYRLYFVWQPEVAALQFTCQFDLKTPEARVASVRELLGCINSRLWLGHFDIEPDDYTPIFRHAMLLRGTRGASPEQFEDLIDIALGESERYYPAFKFVIWGGKSPTEAIEAAILDTVGEA